MGLFSKDIKTIEDLFLHTLQDVYCAENQIVKSLPKMIEKATNRDLASAFTQSSPGDRDPGFAARPSVREGRSRSKKDRPSGHRWSHQGGQRNGGRGRQQAGA
jgi:hypothetical protein